MRVLITGVLGQDGSYLAEQLIADGHEVYGMTRRSNVYSPATLLVGDLLDQDSLERVLDTARPDVVYNLAAITAPGGTWLMQQPPLLAEVTGLGVVKLMDAMLKVTPDAKLVHASSSAIYNPYRYGLYGIAKKFAHDAVTGYRYKLHASNAVMYTSIRQDKRFLAPTIVRTFAARGNGSTGEKLVITDLNGLRDLGVCPRLHEGAPVHRQHEDTWGHRCGYRDAGVRGRVHRLCPGGGGADLGAGCTGGPDDHGSPGNTRPMSHPCCGLDGGRRSASGKWFRR